MPRTNLHHLAAATAMTMAVGAACCPVAWLHLGAAGLALVAVCGLAVLLLAAASDLFVWLLSSSGGSAALWMVVGAACRMAFVMALLILAVKASPVYWEDVPKSAIPIYIIPFYFGLLAVEVFTAKTILSVPARAEASTPRA